MSSFTIKDNDGIRKFFEGSNNYVPINELIYLHTHPLIHPNFMSEINDLAKEAGAKIIAKKITGKPVEDLMSIFTRIGSNLPDIDESNAEEILFGLRDLYKLSNSLRIL